MNSDLFHFLARMNNAALKICVQIFGVDRYFYFSWVYTKEKNCWVI